MHTLIPLYKISNYLVHLHALILINTIIILFFVHLFQGTFTTAKKTAEGIRYPLYFKNIEKDSIRLGNDEFIHSGNERKSSSFYFQQLRWYYHKYFSIYIYRIYLSKKALYNKEVMGRCKKNFLRVAVPSQ